MTSMETLNEDVVGSPEAPNLALVQMLVHDLRSPLMSITHLLQVMLHELSDQLTRDQVEDLVEAMNAGWLLQGMVTSMLGLGQLEADALPVHLAPHDAGELVHAATRTLRGLSRGRRLVVSTPGAPLLAWCDRALTLRVVNNLVANALEHTRDGDDVAVVVSASPGGVLVRVIDSGPGIPREQWDRVFEKWASLDPARGYLGSTGLGLAFSKLAVERQGGRIGLESAVGRGSVFWFELSAA